ncbi:uncharacterized protein LOC130357391 [Hyla sarda]|uniref:uncharacterized protein LOC130357391 n=1 Tax=Hyla sarda TaxID=327740 RepID=UPI0024C24BF5|nr:uncharacterized protein LOC130357391 [Hyla sarda]
MVDEEFKKIKRNTYNDNLTREERQSLERLRNLNDVIIKPADKGGNIIVWPREMYEAEARRQLRDNTCYKKLSFNPLISFKNSLEIILERAEADSTISLELHRALSVSHPKIPTLYLLPKVHKHPTRPPGRPIISDVTLTRDQEGFIQTNVYRKPTATNTYLHATSAHPKHMKDAVPVGQYLRIRRICSTDTMFEKQARTLQKRFKERGYSQRCLKKAYRRARETPRQQLLQKKPPRISDDSIRYISDYNAHWEEMRRAIEKHLPILKTDSVLRHYVPDRLQMTARRARNLKHILVKSEYVSSTPNLFNLGTIKNGCFPCGKCVACPNIVRSTDFSDSGGQKTFKIRHHITCESKAVVYYAYCPCPKIYIGLTTRPLKVRVREHMRDIRQAATRVHVEELKPIARHFLSEYECDPNLLKVKGIDQVNLGIRGGDIPKILAQCESKWIWRLHTLQPLGLNEIQPFAPFL